MRPETQMRSGAWDAMEKMLGAVEHRRICGVTRQTNKVGTSSSLGPAGSIRVEEMSNIPTD